MLKTIIGGLSIDDRGSLRFVNDFNFEGVKRFYQVENHGIGFIRGWHGHKIESKYVYVSRGSALIGAVRLNGSGLERFVLSSDKPSVLFIPAGYANGAMNLTEDCIIQYFSTSTLEESKGDDIRYPFDKWNIWNIEKR